MHGLKHVVCTAERIKQLLTAYFDAVSSTTGNHAAMLLAAARSYLLHLGV